MSRWFLHQAPDDDLLRAKTCSAVSMILYILYVLVCNDGIILLLYNLPPQDAHL
jgi:hypothetical protein